MVIALWNSNDRASSIIATALCNGFVLFSKDLACRSGITILIDLLNSLFCPTRRKSETLQELLFGHAHVRSRCIAQGAIEFVGADSMCDDG